MVICYPDFYWNNTSTVLKIYNLKLFDFSFVEYVEYIASWDEINMKRDKLDTLSYFWGDRTNNSLGAGLKNCQHWFIKTRDISEKFLTEKLENWFCLYFYLTNCFPKENYDKKSLVLRCRNSPTTKVHMKGLDMLCPCLWPGV